MRTAVVRIGVDPSGELGPQQLADGMTTLRELVAECGADVLDNQLAGLPGHRREVEVLIGSDSTGESAQKLQKIVIELCAKAFGTTPTAGVVTFVSRGTDDDAHGVLAGFGLTGEISRTLGGDGWDVVSVTLRKTDLERIPESRIHTALEASLNCEVHIRTM